MTTLGAIAVVGLLAGASQASPYAGQQRRTLKALSADEVADLLAGHGVGFAKAAELNHYPGPRHALDQAETLALTPEQRSALEASFTRMQAEAVRLGRELVDAETALDQLFAEGRADANSLARAVEASARLSGQLRLVHLRAHLETRAVLTAAQVERYDTLRGYSSPAAPAHDPKQHHGPPAPGPEPTADASHEPRSVSR
jgi:Spy/CpxP family protein refolding chaperone